jgi:hypothetical protein
MQGGSMRRYVSVVLLAALALLVFAPAALADSHKMMEDEMMEDEMMMSSASASASAMSSASASAMMEEDMMMEEEMMGSASASASASALPSTGGPQLLPLLSLAALITVVGSGLVAARLVRSNS